MKSEVRGRRSAAATLAVSRHERNGLTLFEVIISLAILLGSLAVLGQLISVGSRAAVRTNMHSRATLLCQAKLADVLAGIEPLQPLADLPVDEYNPEWMWGLEVAPGPHPDLLAIAVTVRHVDPLRAADSTVTLYRYMRRPNLYQEWANALAEEAAAVAEAEAAP
ncbi:MAG: hypothetical protein WD066_11695 [Planctomycetaceae bacterium]